MEQELSLSFDKEETERLDVYLQSHLDGFSRSRIQKMLLELPALIMVNGTVQKSNYKLKKGDKITVSIPAPKEYKVEPENIKLDIVYQDQALAVVNKPKGLVVHPAPGHYSGTLVNALLYHFKGELSGINGVMRPGIVHRIDKDTSGLLLVAKTDAAHFSLSKQLEEHQITRRYHAVVFGKMKELEGSIDAPIGRNPSDRKKMAVNARNGKQAITHYKAIETIGPYTYLSLMLETGRTHQIRVHMASVGHSVLGDEVYSGRKQPFKMAGQTLHAKTIGFTHPVTREFMEFDSPLPAYFEGILSRLRREFQ